MSDQIELIAKQSEVCQRLMDIPGFGPLVSTALTAAVGNAETFSKGRDLAAWIGFPRPRARLRSLKEKGIIVVRNTNEKILDPDQAMYRQSVRSWQLIVTSRQKQSTCYKLWLLTNWERPG